MPQIDLVHQSFARNHDTEAAFKRLAFNVMDTSAAVVLSQQNAVVMPLYDGRCQAAALVERADIGRAYR